MNRDWVKFGTVAAALALIFSALAPAYVARYRLNAGAAASIYLCFLLLLLLTLAPGFRAAREWIAERAKGAIVALPLLWCVPYLIHAAGTGDFQWTALLRLLSIGGAPVLLYRFVPVRKHQSFCAQDAVVALWLIGSLMGHQLSGIWRVPVNLDFLGRLFLVLTGSWTWIYVRPIPALGYVFPIRRSLPTALVNFVLFAVIALPAGLAMRFIAWNPRWTSPWSFLASYVEIFLFIALLEELFFRGFLLNLLRSNLRSERASLILTSCLFGLFHILHAPFPNWPYVALATVAGWFYGSAYLQSGNLLAPALTHAMVDTVWRTFFTAPK